MNVRLEALRVAWPVRSRVRHLESSWTGTVVHGAPADVGAGTPGHTAAHALVGPLRVVCVRWDEPTAPLAWMDTAWLCPHDTPPRP